MAAAPGIGYGPNPNTPAAPPSGAPANPAAGGHYVNIGSPSQPKWQLIHAVGPGKWAPVAPNVAAPKAGKAAEPATTPGQTTAGHWVNDGNGNWQLIHAVGPGKWVPGGVNGAPAPPKPHGTPPPPSNPLKPWSQGDIQNVANSEIQSSYAPQVQSENQAQSSAQAIYDKQQSDNQFYQQWAATQAQVQQTHQDTVNQGVNAVLAGLGNGSNQVTPQQAGLQGENAANLTTNNAANTTLGNNAVENALASEKNANVLAQSAGSNYASDFIQANRMKETGNLNTALQNVANSRAKTTASEQGALIKEITRLQGVQTQKAQYAENLGLTAQKLGLTTAVDTANINKANADAAATTQNAATNAQNALTNISKAAAQAGLDKSTIARNNAAAQNSLAEAKLHSAQAGVAGQKPPLSVPQTAQVFNAIEIVRGELNNIIKNGYDNTGKKLTAQQAYHIIANGGPYWISAPHPYTSNGQRLQSQQLSPRQAKAVPHMDANSTTVLNAAYNLQTGGKINAADLSTLNSEGVYGVRSRYAVGG